MLGKGLVFQTGEGVNERFFSSTLGPTDTRSERLLWTLTLTLTLKELQNWVLRLQRPECNDVKRDLFGCICFLCEQVPSKRWDGGLTGAVQCYSYRSLRQHSPTHWIIIWLCQYCSCVGEEWHHHTLLEPLAVLKVSHIPDVESTDRQHITEPTLTLKPYQLFKRLKDMPLFSPTEAKIDWNWQWKRSEAEEDLNIVEAEDREERLDKTTANIFFNENLHLWGSPWGLEGKRRPGGFATEVFGLFAWGRAPFFTPNPPPPPPTLSFIFQTSQRDKACGKTTEEVKHKVDGGRLELEKFPTGICATSNSKRKKREDPPPPLKTW